MFVRVKRSNNRKTASIQIVEGSRDKATGKVKQIVIKHIGSASSEEEIAKLVELGEFIKFEIEADHQQNLFVPEILVEMKSESKAMQKEDESDYKIDDVRKLSAESLSITGIGEIYGKIYDNLGFDKILYNHVTKLRHIEDKRLFAIPSKPSNDAKIIYKTMNLPLNSLPYLISK